MNIVKRTIKLTKEDNSEMTKVDKLVIEKIVENLLSKHTYYKTNQYNYVFTDSNIKKKHIKSFISENTNDSYIEDIIYTRINENIINVTINSSVVMKIPTKSITKTGSSHIISFYKSVFYNLFEDAIHKIVHMNDSYIIITDRLTSDIITVQLRGFKIFNVGDTEISIIL